MKATKLIPIVAAGLLAACESAPNELRKQSVEHEYGGATVFVQEWFNPHARASYSEWYAVNRGKSPICAAVWNLTTARSFQSYADKLVQPGETVSLAYWNQDEDNIRTRSTLYRPNKEGKCVRAKGI
ncbi:hypothetical protein [Roseateles violae]|uniref:Lipoprotein n=1 Tax=Roseateles violae TaxID=3058042 RepID=A0ABT8DRM9_9BURK|nr:hypothetical protein [Pelomonas sp. PFR6]MDN3918781.1 hypothetical protein [Pelomonas sp. PFR6]